MRLSLAITTLLSVASVASAALGNETSPGSLRGKKKSSSPSSNSLSKTKHSAADRHTPSFNSTNTKMSSPLAVASEPWADDRPSKSKSKPKPERLAGSIVTIKKQVKKGNSSRHLSSQCTDTPEWVDSYGDGCEWYETNDESGCPTHGAVPGYDGGMGLPKDNCCHCQVDIASTPTPTKAPVTKSPSSGCMDTPEWVDSFGDGCEWYETNDSSGCPEDGADWDGGMGVANDNCCHCKDEDATSPTPAPVETPCYCLWYIEPVCGANGHTYSNSCWAGCESVSIEHSGECCAEGMEWDANADTCVCPDGTTEQDGSCVTLTANCWEDGTVCATCNNCCNSWSWKWDVFFTTCGV